MNPVQWVPGQRARSCGEGGVGGGVQGRFQFSPDLYWSNPPLRAAAEPPSSGTHLEPTNPHAGKRAVEVGLRGAQLLGRGGGRDGRVSVYESIGKIVNSQAVEVTRKGNGISIDLENIGYVLRFLSFSLGNLHPGSVRAAVQTILSFVLRAVLRVYEPMTKAIIGNVDTIR
ncbi:hypothetical protein K440DRAFT_641333 [Wilcoxina mikolae CBS 423.85]|nr:hypothetical protein K440DRAFT_641333 [Wilcoxina mikolae CBS 423.85]